MPDIREKIRQYDILIDHFVDHKVNIITFRKIYAISDPKESKTLELLESAYDHIIDNLHRLRQRVLTDVKGD